MMKLGNEIVKFFFGTSINKSEVRLFKKFKVKKEAKEAKEEERHERETITGECFFLQTSSFLLFLI